MVSNADFMEFLVNINKMVFITNTNNTDPIKDRKPSIRSISAELWAIKARTGYKPNRNGKK